MLWPTNRSTGSRLYAIARRTGEVDGTGAANHSGAAPPGKPHWFVPSRAV